MIRFEYVGQEVDRTGQAFVQRQRTIANHELLVEVQTVVGELNRTMQRALVARLTIPGEKGVRIAGDSVTEVQSFGQNAVLPGGFQTGLRDLLNERTVRLQFIVVRTDRVQFGQQIDESRTTMAPLIKKEIQCIRWLGFLTLVVSDWSRTVKLELRA